MSKRKNAILQERNMVINQWLDGNRQIPEVDRLMLEMINRADPLVPEFDLYP